MPIYDWNCVAKKLGGLNHKIEASPPAECPARCYQHTSCAACLSSRGGEGGAHECAWSVVLNQVSCTFRVYRCVIGISVLFSKMLYQFTNYN
jgi:hypothetical protein